MFLFLLVSVFIYSEPLLAFTLTQQNIRGFPDEPLRIHLNAGCPDGVSGALDTAVDFWNSAPHSGLVLERGADVNYASGTITSFSFAEPIVAFCSTNFSGDAGGVDPNTIGGIGTSGDFDNDGQLDRGYLIINANNGATAAFQNLDGANREILVIHEIGHVLGLGHSGDPGAIMYFSTANKSDVNIHRDDVDGIRHLYPQDELGGDYLFGCASIKNIKRPPPPPPFWILMAFPLSLLILLRKRKAHLL
ncbi:MAG: matrixin family metalloprotease [Pseudomonadota bacterium]